MKFCVILGTRPEIIKTAKIVKELKDKDYFVIHTGQHYSYNMDKLFFEELELPLPKHNLGIGSGSHGQQIAKMLIEIEKILVSEKPDVVLVQGDTNTVFAGALIASRLGIKVGHVEAGLRSYDMTMPEEANRIMTDHISSYLFAPTKNQKRILLDEAIVSDKIHVLGNTVVDAVMDIIEISRKKSKILNLLELKKGGYVFCTAHRQENVDDKDRFNGIVQGMSLVGNEFEKKIIYAIHPRARKMLELLKIDVPENVTLIEPVGYVDTLFLLENAALVLTDSGGLQEECCVLKVPCVTLRDNTERPETVQAGANVLAGVNPEKILKMSKEMLSVSRDWENPFGDGTTSKKIIEVIENDFSNNSSL